MKVGSRNDSPGRIYVDIADIAEKVLGRQE